VKAILAALSDISSCINLKNGEGVGWIGEGRVGGVGQP